MIFERYENESDEELIYRVCSKKDTVGSWQDVADVLNKLLNQEYTESKYRKQYQAFQKMLEANQSKFVDSDKHLEELRIQQRELNKERVKLQTENLDYRKALREEARDELIVEKICNAIGNLEKLEIPEYIPPVHNNKTYLCCIADAHFGIEYVVNDLFGSPINEYSPEIFKQRMYDLKNQLIELIDKENITELNLWELGDGIQGIIRLNSQLMKLKYGIIDSAILYADFLANWINELSNYTRIKFQMVEDSNHNQLRICGTQKNAFAEENMSKTMMVLIKERLKDNPNVVIVENATGMNYAQLSTYTVLGCHGEIKGNNAINTISRAYGTPIDYMVAGHVHHSKSEEMGINSEVLYVRSIIGVDPYGMSLNKTSDAGASMFVFEQCHGLVCEYRIKLN